MKFKIIIGICFYFAVLMFSSCSTSPVYLSDHYYVPEESEIDPNMQNDKGCSLYVMSITDHRINKTSLGKVFRRMVFDKSIIQWLTSGLETLDNYGYNVKFKEMDSDLNNIVKMHLKIRMLTIQDISTSMSASLVLNVGYFYDNKLSYEKNYRSTRTKVNWTNSESEINNLFNIILADILNEVSIDAKTYCDSSMNAI